MKFAIAFLALLGVTAYATPAVKVDLLPGLEKALLGNIKAKATCEYEDPYKTDACLLPLSCPRSGPSQRTLQQARPLLPTGSNGLAGPPFQM